MTVNDSNYRNQEFMEDEGSGASASAFTSDALSGEQLDQYIANVTRTVRDNMSHSIDSLTPWFFNNMPTIYYQSTPSAEKVRHLQAILSSDLFETKQTLTMWDKDRHRVTYIGPGGDHQVLRSRVKGYAIQNENGQPLRQSRRQVGHW